MSKPIRWFSPARSAAARLLGLERALRDLEEERAETAAPEPAWPESARSMLAGLRET